MAKFPTNILDGSPNMLKRVGAHDKLHTVNALIKRKKPAKI